MKLKYGELKELIEGVLLERSQNYEQVTLSDGSTCQYGDQAHLEDMERQVTGLECLRNQQRRGTAARSVYAAAVRQLKNQIKKAHGKLPEEERTFRVETDKPGRARKPRVGMDGGLSTSPGHGRYSPGE